jgi:glucan phosphorylase
MSFQIRPLKEFLVRPALPEPLKRIAELAPNLVWSWDHPLRSLFRRLDPTEWKESNHNPVVMLGRVPQETLERAARDPRYLALYRRACETKDAYMEAVVKFIRTNVVDKLVAMGCDYIQIDAPNYGQAYTDPEVRAASNAPARRTIRTLHRGRTETGS